MQVVDEEASGGQGVARAHADHEAARCPRVGQRHHPQAQRLCIRVRRLARHDRIQVTTFDAACRNVKAGVGLLRSEMTRYTALVKKADVKVD